MHALAVEALAGGKIKQGLEHLAALLDSTRVAGKAKMITTARNINAEPIFDLSQMFVELAAEISQALIVGGFENYISGIRYSAQL
jgi:hypothetical protein